MILKLYRPEIFQGNLKMKKYFEGWYFKHVSHDLNNVYSFICGISLTDKDPHSFIQVINGITGKTDYIRYHLNEFIWDRKKLSVKIGKSEFTCTGISIKIENKDIRVEGSLNYFQIVRYPRTLISPGIMGWYSFVPFMECKHGIVSVNHSITGKIIVNDNPIDFTMGKGYIEKDWGTSFPEAWIWLQTNNFDEQETSFSLSVAKIPWLGKYFIGLIAFLYYNKKYYLFSTYNNTKITEIIHKGNTIDITLQSKKFLLKIHASNNTFGELVAPVSGDMSRRIKESVDSEVLLSLVDKNNNQIYNGTGRRAGLEVIDKIFEYI